MDLLTARVESIKFCGMYLGLFTASQEAIGEMRLDPYLQVAKSLLFCRMYLDLLTVKQETIGRMYLCLFIASQEA